MGIQSVYNRNYFMGVESVVMGSITLEEVDDLANKVNGKNGSHQNVHVEAAVPLYQNGQAEKPQESHAQSVEHIAKERFAVLQDYVFNLWVEAGEEHKRLPVGTSIQEKERLVGSLQALNAVGLKAGLGERMREHTTKVNRPGSTDFKR